MRTIGGSRARDRDRVAGIVDLGVVESHRPRHLPRVEIRRELLGLVDIEALGTRHRAAVAANATERVVEPHTRCDVGTLPATADREEEGDRTDQVGSESIEQEAALGQGLVDEAEFALLEVAQPPMGQTRRTRGRAGRKVALLHESDRQAACGGIESRAGAYDATADDGDIDAVRAHEVNGLGARRRREAIIGVGHGTIILPRRKDSRRLCSCVHVRGRIPARYCTLGR